MYQNIYDAEPRRFYKVKASSVDIEKTSSKIEQKGIREYLLCGDCELMLSKYEGYAADTIYNKNKNAKVILRQRSESTDQQFFEYDYTGLLYKEFKIFLMSIQWRIHVSSVFYSPAIDQNIIEQLRTAIHQENPLNYHDFPCLLQIVFYKRNVIADKFILDPFVTNHNGSQVMNVLIDGIMYGFYLSAKELPREVHESVLKVDGTMKIVGWIIFQNPSLLEKLTNAFGALRKRLNS
jgi:hypothetical protein